MFKLVYSLNKAW